MLSAAIPARNLLPHASEETSTSTASSGETIKLGNFENEQIEVEKGKKSAKTAGTTRSTSKASALAGIAVLSGSFFYFSAPTS